MATNQQPVVPPLGQGERIANWRIIFEASTGTIRAQEEGEKRVVQMLPAYINRSFADRECVREVVKTAATVEEALDALSATLDPPSDQYSSRQALCRLSWQPGDSIDHFFFTAKHLASEAGLDFKFVAALVASQLPRDVEAKIKGTVLEVGGDLESADSRKLLADIKRQLNDRGHALDMGCRDFERIVKVAALSDTADDDPSEADKEKDEISERSIAYTQQRGKRGRRYRAQAQPPKSGCYICGEDHQWRYCTKKCCPVCGNRGHSISDCHRKKSGAPRNSIMQVTTLGSELSVLLPVKIANATLEMILDSGAGPSVIDLGTIRDLGLEKRVIRRVGRVYGVGQNPVELIGNITLEVDIGDNQVTCHSFGVLHDNSKTRILGRDLLKKFGSTEFDWDTHRVRLGTVWKDTRAVLEGGDALSRSAVAALECQQDYQGRGCKYAANGCSSGAQKKVSINPDLPEGAKRQLASLIDEFCDVFAENPKSPSMTQNATHRIDTGNHLPVKHKQRRASPATQAQIDGQVTEMLQNGICRPSDSPWSSAIILVTKKDGGTRFVVDYRSLNDLTRKDAYPMPNPRDILDSLLGDNYYSSLDCASAYWAVPIDSLDQPKTAFSTPRGHFEMTRMAFGLCNSQATYQRLMDKTLRGIGQAHSYVDDILIHSPGLDSHINSIRTALMRLRNAKIQLRPDKCRLGYQCAEFVGHLITPDGHQPLHSNVEKILAFKPPRDKLELQRFLGLVNFYRDYISNMASIAEPMYRLTRKGVPYVWNAECHKAFNALKTSLTGPPVLLAYPNWDHPFYVQTDASRVAAGGVLSQLDENQRLRPLAYYSTGLNQSQRKYSAGEVECWALIALSRKFRDYLKAACKTIFLSDHNPLCWLRKQRDPRAKFARWIQELEDLDYEIHYVKGINNSAADFLSRLECEIDEQINDECEFFDRFVYSIPEFYAFSEEVRAEQHAEPTISCVIKQLGEQGFVSYGRYRNQRLAISNNIVTLDGRILVPDRLREIAFGRVHNVSHPGVKRTLYLMRRQFTWNGMQRDIREFCSRCNICHREKGKSRAGEPLEPNRSAHKPRQIVAFDVATLPWGSEQHRYFLLMTDLFSKWVEIAPMRDQTSSSILTALNTSWIHRHGPPEAFLSDQGPNVDGMMIRQALDALGVKKLHSSPYHPQGDGQAERSIQSVKQTLRCILSERRLEKDCWPSVLQEVAYALNTLPSAGTRITPFHIMHGVEPVSNPRPCVEENPSAMTPKECYDQASHNVEQAVESAHSSLEAYRDNMKRMYDRGRGATDVKDGDQVYLRNDAKADSLDPRYNGPFSVVSAQPPNATIDVGDGKMKTVHLDRCKIIPFHSHTNPQPRTGGDDRNTDGPALPVDRTRDSGEHDRDEAIEESGVHARCHPVPDVEQTGMAPRISRYGRVIKKPLRFRETSDDG